MKQPRKILKLILPMALALTLGSAGLTADKAQAQTGSDGWQYYRISDYSEQGSETSGIYKKNVSTGETVKIMQEWVTGEVYQQGDWVYYPVTAPLEYMGGSGMMPSYIMKVKTDGTESTQVSNSKIYTMAVSGDWIVFSNFGSGENEYEGGKLLKMKTDGSEMAPLNGDNAFLTAASGEWIYYINREDDHLYKVNMDGSGKTKLADETIDSYYGMLFVDGDTVLYTGSKEDGTDSGTYAINSDGSNKVKITDKEASITSVQGDWIYFSEYDGMDEVAYKMKRDGTEKTVVTEGQQPVFADVNGHWADETIRWAKDSGISSGYPDGTFQPDKNVTEEEFLKMFLAAYGVQDALGDSASRWSDAYYQFAADHQYPVSGLQNTDAKGTVINRLKVAEIIAKAAGSDATGDQAVQFLLDHNYSKGKTAPTVEGYAGSDSLTRAEAIQFIKNLMENGLNHI